ncbi:MAG TPA: PAS domain-containing protein [Stellaceae bacterium]|nr:PAS domain-containing protein [Stellaceae bacterium]
MTTATHLDGSNAASRITDARLTAAFDYWLSRSTGLRLPRRRDIDPAEIPKLLPILMIVEVLSGRYRYRLIGTENADAFGMNATGRYLDEVLPGPEYKTHVLALYDECVCSRQALYSECLFSSREHRAIERHIKVLFMPLSNNGVRVNQVLVAQVFLHMDPAMRQRHFLEGSAVRGDRACPVVIAGVGRFTSATPLWA